MGKRLLTQVLQSVPYIVELAKLESLMLIDYDEEVDVLYISFGKSNIESDTEMISDDIILRKQNNEIIGVTIMNASTLKNSSSL